MKAFTINPSQKILIDQDKKQFYILSNRKIIPLHEVSQQDLISIRLKNPKVFVLKFGAKTFYSKDIHLASATQTCEHLCASCARCIASEDPKRGCKKVFDPLVSDMQDKRVAVEVSTRIEKYPFIKWGFQSDQTFIVSACSNYKFESNVPKIGRHNSEEIMKLKHGMAQFIDERISYDKFSKWHAKVRHKEDVPPITKISG